MSFKVPYLNSTLKSTQGFTLVEILTALSIIVIAFSFSIPFFLKQGKIVNQFRVSNQCKATMDLAISRIDSLGTSLDYYPMKFSHSSGSVSLTADSILGGSTYTKITSSPNTGPSHVAAFGFFSDSDFDTQIGIKHPQFVDGFDPDFINQRKDIGSKLGISSADYQPYVSRPSEGRVVPTSATTTTTITVGSNGVVLNTPLLLSGAVEYLATKYLNGHNGSFAAAQLLTNKDRSYLSHLGLSGLKDLTIELKVDRFELKSGSINNTSSAFWPRPRNSITRMAESSASSDTTIYEPQYGRAPDQKFTMGVFPTFMSDAYGYRATVKINYTHPETGITESCVTNKDYSLPEDLQNVTDYFYDSQFVRAKAGKVDDDSYNIRTAACPSGSNTSCIGNSFETIFTNLSPGTAPTSRERPECSQGVGNSSDIFIKIRVYNFDKESGQVPLCLDTSQQYLKGISGSTWCPGGSANSGSGSATVTIDESWTSRYTGWVPCEKLRLCNQSPDEVKITFGKGTNTKIDSTASQTYPYVEYQYKYTVTDSTTNNKFWGCEMKFGVGLLDLAGNISYVPAKISPASVTPTTYIDSNDTRPPMKEINPRIYFKPPPCFVCNCKPCKGGKGGGKFFNFLLLAVLVVVTGGFAAAGMGIAASIAGVATVVCVSGGLGCRDLDSNYVPSTNGGSYRSCRDENKGCSCGYSCSNVKPPAPAWTSSLSDSDPLSMISCDPSLTPTYYNGTTAFTSIGGLGSVIPKFAYKTPATGGGYTYTLDYVDASGVSVPFKVAVGDELMYMAFLKNTGKFCGVKVRCVNHSGTARFEVVSDSFYPDDPTTSSIDEGAVGPLNGCYDVKVGTKINTAGSSAPGISQDSSNQCLEVQFMGAPFNPWNESLWKWSNYNEKCRYTDTSAGTINFAGSCPAHLSSGRISPSAGIGSYSYSTTDPGGSAYSDCAQVPSSATTFSEPTCSFTKVFHDGCWGDCWSEGATGTYYYHWCWAKCNYPKYLPESPMGTSSAGQSTFMRSYGNALGGATTGSDPAYSPSTHGGLPFCTLDRSQFDEGYN